MWKTAEYEVRGTKAWRNVLTHHTRIRPVEKQDFEISSEQVLN